MLLNAIYWDASPVIFSLGPISVRWYGLAFAIGFLFGYEIVARMFRHEGAPEKWLGILLAYIVAGTIIGARLGHVFFYEWDYYSQHPEHLLRIWEGGLASHGGTIALILCLWLFSRFTAHKPASWTFDKVVIPTAFVAGLIRLGNLMNSEIYGKVTDLPWGFIFVRNGETLPAHPTQIYEAACYFVLFGILMWMYWKKNAEERPWLITGIFFIWVFGWRFIIEYVKNVQVNSEYDMIQRIGLNMGQALSIPFIIIGIGLVAWAIYHPRQHWTFPNRYADADERSSSGKK